MTGTRYGWSCWPLLAIRVQHFRHNMFKRQPLLPVQCEYKRWNVLWLTLLCYTLAPYFTILHWTLTIVYWTVSSSTMKKLEFSRIKVLITQAAARFWSGSRLIINWLIHWVGDPFVQNLQDTVYPNQKSWGAEILRECSPPSMCHMSGVRCCVSGVKCHIFFLFIFKVVELVRGGSVINGAYPI